MVTAVVVSMAAVLGVTILDVLALQKREASVGNISLIGKLAAQKIATNTPSGMESALHTVQ